MRSDDTELELGNAGAYMKCAETWNMYKKQSFFYQLTADIHISIVDCVEQVHRRKIFKPPPKVHFNPNHEMK